MSLQVLIAHTGDRLRADPTAFKDLDDFKSWLSDAAQVASNNQILLTANGKQIRFQTILVEVSLSPCAPAIHQPNLRKQAEIFLYNRQIVTSQASSFHPDHSKPRSLVTVIDAPPDSIEDQHDIKAWQVLFESRRNWAAQLADQTRSMAREAQAHFDAFEVIERALGVAVGNLQSHIKALQQRHEEAKSWSAQTARDHAGLLHSLHILIPHFASLPAHAQFSKFLLHLQTPGQHRNDPRHKLGSTLKDLVQGDDVHDASASVEMIGTYLDEQLSLIGARVSTISDDAADLIDRVERLFSQSIASLHKNTSQLMEEVDVFGNKISSDYEHVLTLPNNPQSVSRASKTALLHTRNHLPSMREFCEEMAQYLQQVVEQRNQSAVKAVKVMQEIASIEVAYAQVNTTVKTLDIPADAADAVEFVSLLTQLPNIYGALLVEAVRRREWADRIRGESAYLAEDIASYREEEERRRKKWLKNLAEFIKEDAVSGAVLNFELNLKAEENEWPEVTRQDVEDYLGSLRSVQDLGHVHGELLDALQDIDRPTRRQVKKAKGFKLGSIHEAGGLKRSFLHRDNDEMNLLRDANSRLEDEIKGSKSRVRKLEDLLYKQSITSRTSSANFYPGMEPPRSPEPSTPDGLLPSPKSGDNHSLSRQASLNSRRLSANKTSEEKSLARRIVNLEAELAEEKLKRQTLEKDASAKEEVEARLRSEIEESASIKRDLMENLEAQQREFAEDRRLLQDDMKKHQIKAEELEDEIERILGSRDNERAGAEDQVHSAEQELESTRKELSNLQAAVKARDEVDEDQKRSLKAIHETIAPDTVLPEALVDLIRSLEEVSERSIRRAKEVESAAQAAKTDKSALQSSIDKQEREMLGLRSQMQALQDELTRVCDVHETEKARSASLETELEDGRTQLRTIRQRLGEGEKGSELLRQRVEEQSGKAARLSSELAQSKSHVNSLDIELSRLQRRHKELEGAHQVVSQRLEKRSTRDRDLTNRLFSRNQDAIRLLESLGLSVLRSDNGIVIHRTSKLASASMTLVEPQGPSEDVNASILASQGFDASISPRLIQWMTSEDESSEEQAYQEFLSKLDEFNLNTFSEAVVKLKRDVEWTGRKWKQEARGYRDKYHRAKSDADGKIAYRAFKEGDLALFLPTRNQATRPWAAFNVGAPHYFLREHDSHRLKNREWLVARIQKVEERVVNMSKTLDSLRASDGRSIGEASEGGASFDDDNPFELSDGLRWYMLDASEEKSGAPSTPGLGKSTVASVRVDATGSNMVKKLPAGKDASATLNKSLESRRSSTNSKRESVTGVPTGSPAGEASRAVSNSQLRRDSQASVQRPSSLSNEVSNVVDPDQVRREQLLGP